MGGWGWVVGGRGGGGGEYYSPVHLGFGCRTPLLTQNDASYCWGGPQRPGGHGCIKCTFPIQPKTIPDSYWE